MNNPLLVVGFGALAGGLLGALVPIGAGSLLGAFAGALAVRFFLSGKEGEVTASLPSSVMFVVFVLIGLELALSVDISAIRDVRRLWPFLALAVVGVVVSAMIVGYLMSVFLHIDLLTAMLSVAPGGLGTIGAQAVATDANTALITVVQTTRVVLVTVVVAVLIPLLRH